MIICPHCQSENRIGAKFCKNCASKLPVSSAATVPLNRDQKLATSDNLNNPRATIKLNPVTHSNIQNLRTDTKPLQVYPPFVQRPPGAVFSNSFIYQKLIQSDDYQHQYLVTQLDIPKKKQIRFCPNPDCGAFFPPRGDEPEKFCTDCGTVIEPYMKDFVITESLKPISDQLVRLVEKGLSHGAVCAPLDVFVEQVVGSLRYCFLTIPVNPFKNAPDTLQAFKWGVDLSRGLDYLHDNETDFSIEI